MKRALGSEDLGVLNPNKIAIFEVPAQFFPLPFLGLMESDYYSYWE